MRHIRHAATALPILVGLALWAGGGSIGHASERHSFIIAANDGYGIDDCLGEKGECGHVVADAWCAEHGHKAALAFGPAADVTGAIGAGEASRIDQSYVVTCGD